MSVQQELRTATWEDALDELRAGLAAAPDAYRLMASAWEWFSLYLSADVVAVATLGPPEPIGYLFAEGPIDTGTRDGLWIQLVEMAREVRSEPGMYPRRAADRRSWHASSPLPVVLEAPVRLGPWIVQAGGNAAGVVMAWQGTRAPIDALALAALPEAATMATLYLRNLQWLDIDPDPEPPEPWTFEELLESEVSRARRKRVPVSLALIEYRLRDANMLNRDVPLEVQDEVAQVAKQTARKGDRVMPIGDTCLAVVMPKTDARGALIGADRLQKSLNEHFAGIDPPISVRVGVGGRDPEETQASELFARASQALAEARSAHGEAAFLHI